jgi:hypothetical protein
MTNPEFRPGFRLSAVDAVVILITAIAAGVLWQRTWWIGLVIAFVTAHFFLFCKVFRLSRPLELSWAAVFCLLAGGTIAIGWPGWTATVIGLLITTTIVLVIGMRMPDYHGIMWERINPRLRAWWDAQFEAKSAAR